MAPVDREDPSYELRHSAAHVLAQAVKEMFPEAKLGWGPPHDRFENGFYYDFDLPRSLTPEDFPEVEERMRRIVRGNHPFEYRTISADEAREMFEDQPYKLETLEELIEGKDEYGETRSGDVISTYKHDTFEDLCLGPHLERTGQIIPDGFKLLGRLRGVLARERGQRDAPARPRHGLAEQGGPRELPVAARGRGEARPPPPRRRARPLQHPARGRTGSGPLPSQGRFGPGADGGLLA